MKSLTQSEMNSLITPMTKFNGMFSALNICELPLGRQRDYLLNRIYGQLSESPRCSQSFLQEAFNFNYKWKLYATDDLNYIVSPKPIEKTIIDESTGQRWHCTLIEED